MTARGALARAGAVAALVLSLAACPCPAPKLVEQTFVLDATGAASVDLADASPAAGADAASDGGPGVDSGGTGATSSFQGTPPALTLDCTSAAAGCALGGECPAACVCVLARDHVTTATPTSCRLLAGAGPRQVRVRYTLPAFCGD